MTCECDAGGEIGWFPCQYVERRGAAAARNSVGSNGNICSGVNSGVGAAASVYPTGDGSSSVARPVSECDLPLHARLSQISMPSDAAAEAVTGDDLESDVAEFIAEMQKRMSPIADGSRCTSVVSSPPSTNSRGSIDRVLLLSVVGPACSVIQAALAPSPPPAAAGDVEHAHMCDAGAVESSLALHDTAAAVQTTHIPAVCDEAAAAVPAAAAEPSPAPRIALEFKWMLWTGSAYELPPLTFTPFIRIQFIGSSGTSRSATPLTT